MGNTTLLHGYIYAPGFATEMNAMSIFALPREDTWPYVTFDLFAVPRTEHCYNDLLVTFGTTYKNFDLRYGWPEWQAKFEALLRTMSWYNASVYLDIESVGRYHYIWSQVMWRPTDYEWPKDVKRALADSRKASRNPVERWTFSGGRIGDDKH